MNISNKISYLGDRRDLHTTRRLEDWLLLLSPTMRTVLVLWINTGIWQQNTAWHIDWAKEN